MDWKAKLIIAQFLVISAVVCDTLEPFTTALNWETQSLAKPFQIEQKPMQILIDPGHGGKDVGASGELGLAEKNLALTLSYMVLSDLKKLSKLYRFNSEIRLSRNNDMFVNLTERVEMANVWGADYFISIHFNSSTLKTAKGYEIYFLSNEASDEEVKRLVRIENQSHRPIKSEVLNILSDAQNNRHIQASSAFAEIVYQSLFSSFPSKSRRGIRQGPFTVLVGTDMPAILIEAGYITNPEEAVKLATPSYLKSLASAISSGIMDFIIQYKRV